MGQVPSTTALCRDLQETVFCQPEKITAGIWSIRLRAALQILSILLAVGHTNSLQQVIGWKREEFEDFSANREEVDYISSPQVQQVLKTIT